MLRPRATPRIILSFACRGRHFSIGPPRGTHDLFEPDLRKHRYITECARKMSLLYGFEEIATPIIEHTDIFTHSLGQESDVVMKEMYSFVDKENKHLTLRPEGTAPVARAVITHDLVHRFPLRVFYHGPMFRFETPQHGRTRQFHQIGAEILGMHSSQADVELLSFASHFLSSLRIPYRLEVNSLGDRATQAAYRASLRQYFSAKQDQLSKESQARLSRGSVLRILDSKESQDRDAIAAAPPIEHYYTSESRARWEEVRRLLQALGIPHEVNPRLVRGLDYYTHTIYEFIALETTMEGSQRTILAGGRYDGLVEILKGAPIPGGGGGGGGDSDAKLTPGVGWAAGVERLASMVSNVEDPLPPSVAVILIRANNADEAQAVFEAGMRACHALRGAGHLVRFYPQPSSTTKMMFKAVETGVRAVVFIGPDEIKQGTFAVRFLEQKKQIQVPQSELLSAVACINSVK